MGGTVRINEDATLTLEKNAVLNLTENDIKLQIEGTLHVKRELLLICLLDLILLRGTMVNY